MNSPFIKNYFLLIISFLCLLVSDSVAQWNENFDQGWKNGLGWMGNTTSFTEEAASLRSDNIMLNHSYYISKSIQTWSEMEWQIKVNLKFNTSSLNYTDIYLWTDSFDISKSLRSYFIRIGNSRDELALYRIKDAGTPELMIDGRDNISAGSNNEIYLKVTRNKQGDWNVFSQTLAEKSWFNEGRFTDTLWLDDGYFGLLVKQSTASFFKKHFFDDIYVGPVIRDTQPPVLLQFKFLTDTSIQLDFNEPVIISGSLDSFFKCSGAPVPTSFKQDKTGESGILTLLPGFSMGGNYLLQIFGLKDSSGNRMKDTILSFRFEIPVEPRPGDILITEIMVDPDPVVQLPPAEFIELYNRSANLIELGGLILRDPGNSAILPQFTISPGKFVILCSPENKEDFSFFGDVLGVSGMPSFNNSGDSISLLDAEGIVLDQLFFTSRWYKDALKSGGGYSLELIDTGWSCNPEMNWRASADAKGGTPAVINSVAGFILDTLAPEVGSIKGVFPDRIIFQLSEMPDTAVFNAAYSPNVKNFVLKAIEWNEFPEPSISLFPLNPLEVGVEYEVTIDSLMDCTGNMSRPVSFTLRLPEQPEKGDIVINEVLFNPVSGGSDYVELLNRSQKTFDLSALRLSTKDTLSGTALSRFTTLLFPGNYCLLTEDIQQVTQTFPEHNLKAFMEIDPLPSMPDNEGQLFLTRDSGLIIDQINYSEEWHHPLINNPEGVSLEKIKPELLGNSSDHWHSASSTSGYGTPGLPNSQYQNGETEDGVLIAQPVFSPDGDGYQDMLLIEIKSEYSGWNMNITVLDILGRKVKDIAQGELLGVENLLQWNGTDLNNRICQTGVYVVYIELWNPTARIKRYKIPVTLAAKIQD